MSDPKRQRRPQVAVWDPNPFNPYGAEVARVMSLGQIEVIRLCRRGDQWRQAGVRRWAWLPSARQGEHGPVAIFAYALGAARFFAWAVVRKPLVVVAWLNTRPERWCIRALQLMGCPTVIVTHNPVAGRDEASGSRLVTSLRRHASAVVVHSSSLAQGVGDARKIIVAGHPLYETWASIMSSRTSSVPSRRHRTAVFIGGARNDKGFGLLPEIARSLAARDMRLSVAVGRVSKDQVSALEALPNVSVSWSSGHLSDVELMRALNEADVLLAPYSLVTASGTVLMALTCGLPVAAFDCTAFEALLPRSWLDASHTPDGIAAVAEDVLSAEHDPVPIARAVASQASSEWAQVVGLVEEVA